MRAEPVSTDDRKVKTPGKKDAKDRRIVVGWVSIYRGHHEAELVAEVDPDGRKVTHARVLDADAIDWMAKKGTITRAEWAAGDHFRGQFHLAGLRGRYGAVRYDDAPRGGGGDIGNRALDAKRTVATAMSALPERCRAPVWFIIGESLPIREYVNRVNVSGHGRTSRPRAAADIRLALDLLVGIFGFGDRPQRRNTPAPGATKEIRRKS